MLISIHNLACMYTWVYFVSLSLARVLEGFFFSPQDNITVTFKAMLFFLSKFFPSTMGVLGIKLKSSGLEAGRYLYHWALFQPLLEFPKCWSSSHSLWGWFCSLSSSSGESGWSWLPWQWWPAGTWEAVSLHLAFPCSWSRLCSKSLTCQTGKRMREFGRCQTWPAPMRLKNMVMQLATSTA